MDKFKEKVVESPFVRTIIFFISVIVTGVCCGGFVNELTSKNGEVVIENFYKTKFFWAIIVLFFLFYVYNKFLYKTENYILNFMDENYCRAYAKSKVYPELLKKHAELMKNGKNYEELKEAKSFLEDLIK